MDANTVIKEEIAKIETNLTTAYTELGRCYLSPGVSSASFKTAERAALNFKKRRSDLYLVLEVLESDWVTKRVAEAS